MDLKDNWRESKRLTQTAISSSVIIIDYSKGHCNQAGTTQWFHSSGSSILCMIEKLNRIYWSYCRSRSKTAPAWGWGGRRSVWGVITLNPVWLGCGWVVGRVAALPHRINEVRQARGIGEMSCANNCWLKSFTCARQEYIKKWEPFGRNNSRS